MNKTKGMTLVEVIVGAAILILASVLLASGFVAAAKIQVEGDRIQHEGMYGAGLIEDVAGTSGLTTQTLSGTVDFEAGGTVAATVSGELTYAVEDSTGDTQFAEFAPEGIDIIYPGGGTTPAPPAP